MVLRHSKTAACSSLELKNLHTFDIFFLTPPCPLPALSVVPAEFSVLNASVFKYPSVSIKKSCH